MGVARCESKLDGFFATLSSELASLPVDVRGNPAVGRLNSRMRKRAAYNRPNLDVEAWEKFRAINAEVGLRRITVPDKILWHAQQFVLINLERYTSYLDEDSIQVPIYTDFLYDNWRFGPGASNGVKGTHTADKIRQDMTCTAQCVPLVRTLRSRHHYLSCFDAQRGGGVTVISGSRMTTVPKNEDTVRTIAIEPSGNMALQLAAGRYLENVLRRVGLDISTQQPRNKALAKRGSIDGSLATIDLSSASDMISPDLVRAIFPPEWYRLFVVLRSPTTELPDGSEVVLNMMSTMGNGFTFPLMTLLFCALIYGFRATRGGPNLFIDWNSTCVFGDDIIIPTDEYHDFVDVLTMAGFSVNLEKSYSEGPFRESCGGDYYEGVDITPFYVKTLDTPADVYVAINQVLKWSGDHFPLYRTTEYLVALLQKKVYLVPEWLNPNQGILTTLCPAHYKYLSVVPIKKRRLSDVFDMPLAVGGFIEQSGPHFFYTPRSKSTKVCVRSARLPRGYLVGRCTERYSDLTSSSIAAMLPYVLT